MQARIFSSVLLVLLVDLFLANSSAAQPYAIDWHKISGGGGTSTNGQFSITGTIGQPDASGALNGGSYSVTGGFWSLINVVQTPGVPNLLIVPNGLNSVKISWPATGSSTLQQNSSLIDTNGWIASGYTNTLVTVNGTNSVTITPPLGNLFFRLKQ